VWDKGAEPSANGEYLERYRKPVNDIMPLVEMKGADARSPL
jgi:hypothetical protein